VALTLVTAPTAEPVSLDEVKLHLRVDSDAEDTLIAGLNSTARDYAESFTQRAIPQQTWDLKLDGFPCEIWLPKAPCISVTSITYIDTNGDSQTLSTALYTADLPVGPKARAGRIVPAYNQHWPQTRCVPNAVTVRFVAGYAGTALTLASLTQTAGVATATVTAGHGMTDLQMVTIAGASQAGYNGSFVATVVSATTFTFSVASATVSPATGTVTATPDPVPAGIKAAIKILVATWFGPVREAVNIGNITNEIPMAVNALLWPFKSF
jgi:uncharacterized phiE125 gp8 family phage protein